ncbi:hypothetical protein FOL75_13835 [Bacillus thuringiensis]|uniref:Uncharacterized protein n=1 Tax=Bacillus thuringiensis TaxID=1428 RepID=A0A9X6Z347_BACTU|nr:hypothetical protein [Bacillus thuringiensis]PFA97482.1 hypothetical protein CN398_21425 [Bacillus thuringiensis]
MNLDNNSLLKACFEIMKTKIVVFFTITSIIFFIGFIYVYNQKFPNHKYPQWVEFLKYIS